MHPARLDILQVNQRLERPGDIDIVDGTIRLLIDAEHTASTRVILDKGEERLTAFGLVHKTKVQSHFTILQNVVI